MNWKVKRKTFPWRVPDVMGNPPAAWNMGALPFRYFMRVKMGGAIKRKRRADTDSLDNTVLEFTESRRWVTKEISSSLR